ncbi:MAG: nucleotide excision repair endonuclease [bacterium]|nr:nucleotide excision repair endonuclease [bacterium]
MGLKRFDRKFGADLLRELPAEPGVYLFKDEEGTVLYAGKAKNIRRRLQGYRNASRRKVHRKMRTIVREASTLEVRIQPSERDALLVENELIRTLRPRYNVEGAYTFLYPAIGTAAQAHQSFLVFSTRVDAYPKLNPSWHGVFRSRHRTRDAFDALVALLDLLGHREPRSRLPELPLVRGSRVVAFRRIENRMPGIERLLGGESQAVLKQIAGQLLEKPDARENADQVGEDLRLLDAFYESDARKLRLALRAAGRRGCFVSQEERDALFIAHPPG